MLAIITTVAPIMLQMQSANVESSTSPPRWQVILPQRLCHITTALWTLALVGPQIRTVRNAQQYVPDCSTRHQPYRNSSLPAIRPALCEQISQVGTVTSAHHLSIGKSHRATPTTAIALPGLRKNRQHGDSPQQIRSQPHRASRSGLLSPPMAEASDLAATSAAIAWDEQQQSFVITDDTCKGEIIHKMVKLLTDTKQISAEDAPDLAFQWRQSVTEQALYLVPIVAPPSPAREKRRSFKDIDDEIERHIEENCAFETEIINHRDLSQTEVKLFSFQSLAKQEDNPLLSILQYLGDFRQAKPIPEAILKAADFIMLFPAKELHGFTINALIEYYKRQHYQETGDHICLRRQNHLLLAHVATSLDIAGLGQIGSPSKAPRKPAELMHATKLESGAIYFSRNRQAQTRTELIMTAKGPQRTGGHPHGNSAGKINDRLLLKTRNDLDYVALEHRSGTTKKNEIPIFFDDAAGVWRETSPPYSPLLNVEFQSGNTFIKLHGEQYLIRMTSYNKYQVVVNHANGIKEFIPLYRDQLSKNWHLETSNRNPIFSPTQAKIIERIKAPLDHQKHYEAIANGNPSCYGNGKLIKVSDKTNDNVYHTLVEMKGELVPVRAIHIENQGIRYDAYNFHDITKDGYPIEWDSERWRLEAWTSPYLSKELRQQITPDMYVKNLNPKTLAGPDHRGMRWDSNNNGYIRIRKNFVQLYPPEKSTLKTESGKVINLHYKNEQFHALPMKPEKPIRVTDDGLITKSFTSLFEYALENYFVPSVGKTDLYDGLISLFQTNEIEVKEIPATALDKRQFYFSIEGMEFIAYTTQKNQTMRMLKQTEFDQALEKYNTRQTGGKIKQVLGLTQEEVDAGTNLQARSPEELQYAMLRQMHKGMQRIERTIEQHLEKNTSRNLVLSNNDFFGTGALFENAYAPPASTFQALIDLFIPLSKKYPEAVIIPGTIYLSERIPDALRNSELHYAQQDRTEQVKDKVHFSAIIAPVFFRGQLVTIARKGEYLRYRTPDEQNDAPAEDHDGGLPEKTATDGIRLNDLDRAIPAGAQLIVQNENQDSLLLPKDSEDHYDTIFSGKTLLPDERAQVERILRPHMRDHGSEDVFQSEFVIDDEKFLLVIGNEFKSDNRSPLLVRELALSNDRHKIHGKRYDWILHPSAGEALDQTMRSAAQYYLQVDSGEQNQYASDLIERIHFMETQAMSDLIVHNYRRKES